MEQQQQIQAPRAVQKSYHFTKEFPTSQPLFNQNKNVFYKIAGNDYIDIDQSIRYKNLQFDGVATSSFYQALETDISLQGQGTFQLNGRMLCKYTNMASQMRAYYITKLSKKMKNEKIIIGDDDENNGRQIPYRFLAYSTLGTGNNVIGVESYSLRHLLGGVIPEHIRYIPITTYLQLSFQCDNTVTKFTNQTNAGLVTFKAINGAGDEFIQLCRLDYVPEGPDVLSPDPNMIPYLQQDPFAAQTVINCTQSIDGNSICQDQYITFQNTGAWTDVQQCTITPDTYPISFKKNSKYLIDQCENIQQFQAHFERICSEGNNVYFSTGVIYNEWDYMPGQQIQYDIKYVTAALDTYITYIQQRI